MWGTNWIKQLKDFCFAVRSICSYKDFEANSQKEQRRSYVVFIPYDLIGRKFWIHECLNKNCCHVFVIFETPNGLLKIDSLANVADISYLKKDYTIDRYVKVLKRNKCIVLRCNFVPTARMNEYLPLKINPQNCVSLTKAVLGISPRKVFTPYQLYSFLCRQAECGVI